MVSAQKSKNFYEIRKFWCKKAKISINLRLVPNMDGTPTRADLRRALQKKSLTFLLADFYDKFPKNLAIERGLTFTPLVPRIPDRTNPAKNSACLLADHDAKDPSPQKGNFLMPDKGLGKFILNFLTKCNFSSRLDAYVRYAF